MRFFTPFFLLIFSLAVYVPQAQPYRVEGKVVDAEKKEPLAFVNIIINEGKHGGVTDIDGKFSLSYPDPIRSLTFSYMGYKTQVYQVSAKTTGLLIRLQPFWIELSEVEIKPGVNPAHRIISNAIASRDLNDPEKLPSFSYTSYDKMYFTVQSDSLYLTDTLSSDTSESELRKFLEDKYFFLMETVSERKFLYPDHHQERVIASRISGLKDPIVVFLLSQLQSTSFYDDVIRITDKNYINPISRGSLRNYLFVLQDTLFHPQSLDTTFVIYYRPLMNTYFDGLEGLLYINTYRWAVENVVAGPYRHEGGLSVKIQQKYELVDGQHWFPVQLNTDLVLHNVEVSTDSSAYPLVGIGKSYLKDIRINAGLDKKEFSNIEIEVLPDAYTRADQLLAIHRIDNLSRREANTYSYIDSIGREYNFDELAKGFETLMTGKIPWKWIDLDMRKFIRYNDYEGIYLGVGAETNQKVSRLFSVGGFVGYGFRDKHIKFGTDLSLYPYREAEIEVNLSYQNDVSEPGGTHYFDDFQKFSYENYREPLLMRMDRIEKFAGSFGFRSLSYLKTFISFSRTYKEPGYDYYFGKPGEEVTLLSNAFTFTEGAVSIRYAYKEKFLKNVRTKVSLGTPWPIVWFTYTRGFQGTLGGDYSFNRYDLKIQKSFFIKYLGETNFMLKAGYIDAALPCTNLYNGNGSYHTFTIFAPHSFATMGLNEFVIDRYVAFYLTHNFGKLLFRTRGFEPELELTTNIGFGSLKHTEYHHHITIKTMEQGFFESGLNINKLLNLSNLISMGLGVHYRYGPYHLAKEMNNFAFKFTMILPLLSNSN
ncbi:MAG: DUF5686 family protein [Bacteroidales bacterium]|nr:carboxypeptidase-like regulatory domain-containing protein [Lentimicrobiaceae bacterium]MDD5694321.1 DUF5686 family protein [Bacteroidales bacterium]